MYWRDRRSPPGESQSRGRTRTGTTRHDPCRSRECSTRAGRNEAKGPVVINQSYDTRSSKGRWSNDQLRGKREARGSSIATRLDLRRVGAACGRMPNAPREEIEYTRIRMEVDRAVPGVRSRQIWLDPLRGVSAPTPVRNAS